jgi:hypothetical protein
MLNTVTWRNTGQAVLNKTFRIKDNIKEKLDQLFYINHAAFDKLKYIYKIGTKLSAAAETIKKWSHRISRQEAGKQRQTICSKETDV